MGWNGAQDGSINRADEESNLDTDAVESCGLRRRYSHGGYLHVQDPNGESTAEPLSYGLFAVDLCLLALAHRTMYDHL